LVHFLNTIGPSLTKVIYAYFDRISYRYTKKEQKVRTLVSGSTFLRKASVKNMKCLAIINNQQSASARYYI
jgi:hypothetical protein